MLHLELTSTNLCTKKFLITSYLITGKKKNLLYIFSLIKIKCYKAEFVVLLSYHLNLITVNVKWLTDHRKCHIICYKITDYNK